MITFELELQEDVEKSQALLSINWSDDLMYRSDSVRTPPVKDPTRQSGKVRIACQHMSQVA